MRLAPIVIVAVMAWAPSPHWRRRLTPTAICRRRSAAPPQPASAAGTAARGCATGAAGQAAQPAACRPFCLQSASKPVFCASTPRPGRSRFAARIAPAAGPARRCRKTAPRWRRKSGGCRTRSPDLKRELAALQSPPPPRPPAIWCPTPARQRRTLASARRSRARPRLCRRRLAAPGRHADEFSEGRDAQELKPCAARTSLPGRLSEITRATPQLIASATLRVETPAAGFTDISADVRGVPRADRSRRRRRC